MAIFTTRTTHADQWTCGAPQIQKSTTFVAAQSVQLANAAKPEKNLVPFSTSDIAKYAMINSYNGAKLNCEKEDIADLGEVYLCTAIEKAQGDKICPKPTVDFLLRRPDTAEDLVYVKNRCDGKLQKFKIETLSEGNMVLRDEKLMYQLEHQVFRGTVINSEPTLNLDTRTGQLSIDGYLMMPDSVYLGTSYYAKYSLETKCVLKN